MGSGNFLSWLCHKDETRWKGTTAQLTCTQLLVVESPVPWLFGLAREYNEEISHQLFLVLLFSREGFKPVINLLTRALVAVYHLPTGISFSEFYATVTDRLFFIFFLLSDVLIKLHTNFVQAQHLLTCFRVESCCFS